MDNTVQRSRVFERLERLVAINTENPPGREVEAVAFLAQDLTALGFGVDTVEFAPGRANVTARIENGAGPVFAFNSHIDVVPAGDGWSRDPFRLVEVGDRLYGRGACDAKGPIAAMLESVRMLIAERHSWRGTLMASFVADEEVASIGAKTFVREKPSIDYVVVGEPTSNAPVIAHKGSLRPLVRVHGRAAHSGTPDLGVNAIFKAAALLGLIGDEHRKVAQRRHDLVGSASLTVTRVHGGHADNVIPSHCDFLLDRRLVPGEDETAVKGELQLLLDTASDEFGVEAEILEYRPTTGGATETAADHPIVRAAQRACASHRAETSLQGFQGACDLVHFRSVGAQGIVLGPGSLAVAHKPDEFVPIDELLAASAIYHDIARDMLRPA